MPGRFAVRRTRIMSGGANSSVHAVHDSGVACAGRDPAGRDPALSLGERASTGADARATRSRLEVTAVSPSADWGRRIARTLAKSADVVALPDGPRSAGTIGGGRFRYA